MGLSPTSTSAARLKSKGGSPGTPADASPQSSPSQKPALKTRESGELQSRKNSVKTEPNAAATVPAFPQRKKLRNMIGMQSTMDRGVNELGTAVDNYRQTKSLASARSVVRQYDALQDTVADPNNTKASDPYQSSKQDKLTHKLSKAGDLAAVAAEARMSLNVAKVAELLAAHQKHPDAASATRLIEAYDKLDRSEHGGIDAKTGQTRWQRTALDAKFEKAGLLPEVLSKAKAELPFLGVRDSLRSHDKALSLVSAKAFLAAFKTLNESVPATVLSEKKEKIPHPQRAAHLAELEKFGLTPQAAEAIQQDLPYLAVKEHVTRMQALPNMATAEAFLKAFDRLDQSIPQSAKDGKKSLPMDREVHEANLVRCGDLSKMADLTRLELPYLSLEQQRDSHLGMPRHASAVAFLASYDELERSAPPTSAEGKAAVRERKAHDERMDRRGDLHRVAAEVRKELPLLWLDQMWLQHSTQPTLASAQAFIEQVRQHPEAAQALGRNTPNPRRSAHDRKMDTHWSELASKASGLEGQVEQQLRSARRKQAAETKMFSDALTAALLAVSADRQVKE